MSKNKKIVIGILIAVLNIFIGIVVAYKLIEKSVKDRENFKYTVDKISSIPVDTVNNENNKVTTIDIETTGLSSAEPIKKYTLNQEEIYIIFGIIDSLTFSKETCDGFPTYYINYNSEEKENFVTYGIEIFENEYHITSNGKGEAILSSEQKEKLNKIIEKLYDMSLKKEPIEIIENTTIQGVVEINHNGYIYMFNGQHFGEYGFEMQEYTSANIDDKKQICIDYYTTEKYDTSYIEEGDLIICTGDLRKYLTCDNDLDTKDNPIIVLKSMDYYNVMQKEVVNNKRTATITVGEYYETGKEIYIKYNIYDKEYNLPFVLKFNITNDTQIIGNLEKGKKIKVQYKNLNVPLDELELKSIEVIDK